ncbi:thiol reductant ABC exporter subunit CydC [Trichlorobacter sp.]|uniref:thiol reductant ABC exporter subunit CydC n=1 Tax=Trichlorobacter sp. TaxID=2911007 RepID=UPI002A367603|nr:thiol reductant ABC exporter subunit CydC [Trichlorobacter sp.]MDY0385069.1 thiol reductant ABC exporter subunit CydC [Trichlorobacter sp.]
MRELLRILRPARQQWRWMLAGIGLSVAVIAANTALMAVSGWFIASMAVAGVAKVSFNFFFPSAAIRLLAILRTVGRYAERLVTHEAAFRILADLRSWLFRRLIPLAPAGLERYASGDLSGRLRADIDSLESLYLRIIAPICSGVASILLAGLFISWFSATAALVLLALLLVAGLVLPLWMLRLAKQPGQQSVDLTAALRNQVSQGLQGAEELLLLGASEHQAAEVERLSAELINRQVSLGRLAGLSGAGVVSLAGLALVLVAVAVIPEVSQQQVSGPQLVMLLLFTAAVFEGVGPLSHALQLLPATIQSVERIRELADAPPALPEPEIFIQPEGYRIELQGVSCSYSGGPAVLEQFSLTLAEGERVAVVGASGSGKSTLVELLLRFRNYQGSITIGGVELSDCATDELNRLLVALPQAPHLFNATIRDNILLGRTLSDQQLSELVEDCGLDAWIATLPLGLDTPVGETGNAVSGGEARRIALARTLVTDAPVVLLDEPTEGLDGATEQVVVQRLHKRLAGRSVLVVTHRPTVLALAQRVVRIG